MKELLTIFEDFVGGESLLLSYNPLMSIVLTCDLLNKLGPAKGVFRDQCNEMVEELLTLGEIYSSKIEDEDYFEELVQDLDFNGRSVLNIICYSQFQ